MWTFPEKKTLRKMGYLKDQKGILNRYLREQGNWENHIMNTRRFILSSLEGKKPSVVKVLGSGWLLDFPLEEVYSVCRNIELIDINHPSQLINRIKYFPGVQCISADITGGMIEIIYDSCRGGREIAGVGNLIVPQPKDPGKNVFYISLNILNQLDILLIDYLKKYFTIDENALLELRKKIQQAHINLISGHDYCLISDVSEILINRKGQETEGKRLVFAEPENYINEDTWKWHFDSLFSYYSQYKTVFVVKAFSC